MAPYLGVAVPAHPKVPCRQTAAPTAHTKAHAHPRICLRQRQGSRARPRSSRSWSSPLPGVHLAASEHPPCRPHRRPTLEEAEVLSRLPRSRACTGGSSGTW